MIRPNNLELVYSNFSPFIAAHMGSLKTMNLSRSDFGEITTAVLIEAERFWAATLLQLVASRKLQKHWLHTWADVTFYYAQFFTMNAVLRLAGRALTFENGKIFRVQRTSATSQNYTITMVHGADHKAQWNMYYDLIQTDITDDVTLRNIFTHQLEFKHSEREFRQWINYDLEYGFDERHWAPKALQENSDMMQFLKPFLKPEECFGDDAFMEIAIVVYTWKHLKNLLKHIAQKTGFASYWKIQIEKLQTYFVANPLDDELKEWIIQELKSCW